MKKTSCLVIFLLCAICSILFAEDVEKTDVFALKYSKNPVSFSMEIDFESSFQKSGSSVKNKNSYEISGSTSLIDGNYYLDTKVFGPLQESKQTENTKEKDVRLPIDYSSQKVILLNLAKEKLFQSEYVSEQAVMPQITLPPGELKLNEVWEGTLISPFFGKTVKTENQIIRTYGDIAVIESKTKSPFDGTPIWSVAQMEERKYENNTRFTFDYEDSIGTADVCGNGVYYFNMREGYVENAVEFFSFIGTLKPKSKKTTLEEAKTDFVYMFVNASKVYKGKVLKN